MEHNSRMKEITGNLKQDGMDLVIRELIDAAISFRVLGNYKEACGAACSDGQGGGLK